MLLEINIKNRWLHGRLVPLVLGAVLFFASPLWADEQAEDSSASHNSFTAGDGLLWGLVGLEALAYGLDLFEHVMPIGPPLIGPGYDSENPDVAYLLSDETTSTIGLDYKEEAVPTSWIIYGALGSLAGLNGVEALRGGRDWRSFHDLTLGLAASMFTTVTVTEVLKRGVGRLRPDFRDRFVARGCQPGALSVDVSALPCDEVQPSLKSISQKDFDYGRRSFPSGHASSSFALGTFTALYFLDFGIDLHRGGQMSHALMSWGASTVTLGIAGMVAGSRLTDNRHHLTDVLVGSALGSVIAAGFYFGLTRRSLNQNLSQVKMGLQPTRGAPLFTVQAQW